MSSSPVDYHNIICYSRFFLKPDVREPDCNMHGNQSTIGSISSMTGDTKFALSTSSRLEIGSEPRWKLRLISALGDQARLTRDFLFDNDGRADACG